jgi:hypothetical protein
VMDLGAKSDTWPGGRQRTECLCTADRSENARFCRVEGISASSTRVALACDFIPAVTRTGVLNPGRAQAVVPPGEMLQVQQLPPAVTRSPADSPAARRVACMATLSSSRVASCSRGRRGARAPVMVPVSCFPGPAGTIRPGGGGCRSSHRSTARASHARPFTDPRAALNFMTTSAGTRPRSLTSMPWDLAHTRTAVEPAGPSPALRPLRPGRREPAGARRAESTYLVSRER